MSKGKLAGIIGALAVVIFIVVVAMRSPVSPVPEPPSGFLAYNDIVNGFVIIYPEDWEMIPKETARFAAVGFWDRQQGADINSFYVMNAVLPYAMDVEDYFESVKGYFRGEYPYYTPVSTETMTVNGRKAIRHTWTFDVDGVTYKYVRQYMVHRKTIWLLEAGCTLGSFDNYRGIYNTMMSGLHILG